VNIILQCITTTWESGTPSETPVAFALPTVPTQTESLEHEMLKPGLPKPGLLESGLLESGLLEHNVSFYQLDGWTKPRERSRRTALQTKTVRDGLVLEITGEELNVIYAYSGNIGKPARDNPAAFTLRPGEWARVTHNGIHTDAFEKKTWFSRIVWNIGHAPAIELGHSLEFEAQMFIGSQPDAQHDDTVKLEGG
jgi:hypothetical protein